MVALVFLHERMSVQLLTPIVPLALIQDRVGLETLSAQESVPILKVLPNSVQQSPAVLHSLSESSLPSGKQVQQPAITIATIVFYFHVIQVRTTIPHQISTIARVISHCDISAFGTFVLAIA
jgi:hypothetical protein